MPGFEFFGKEERKEVNDVLDTGVLMRYNFDALRNDNWKAKELEQIICDKTQAQYAHVCSSGTAALTTAMASLGIGAGDEVIMPTFTFVASFEAVISVGAIPILVDVDRSLTIDPKAVKNAITERTKCIMPVHMCGGMAQLDELKSICKEHNLVLLEDACQAIGGMYKGAYLGTIGDAGCFSFDYVKTVTCGEGGAVLTNRNGISEKVSAFTDHGHDHIGSDRGAEQHPFLGYNFRISELNAAVGVAQFKKLDKIIETQRRYKAIIKQKLSELSQLEFRHLPDESGDNAGFLSFFLPTKELTKKAHKAMSENGLDSNFYWFDNNWHYIKKWNHLKRIQSLYPLCKELKNGLPNYENADFSKSDGIISRTISSLIKVGWTKNEVEQRAERMAMAIQSIL